MGGVIVIRRTMRSSGGLGGEGADTERAIRSSLTLPVTDSVCGVRGTTKWFARRFFCLSPAVGPPGIITPVGMPIGIIAPGLEAPCAGPGTAPAGMVGGVGAGPVDGRTDGVGKSIPDAGVVSAPPRPEVSAAASAGIGLPSRLVGGGQPFQEQAAEQA